MNVTLSQLRLMVQLVESGSFTAAAAALRTSQPSLSRAVRELEAALGLRLFDRTTRSVTPTRDGRELYGVAVDIVRGFDEGLGRFAAYRDGTSGVLTVTAIPSLAASVLPRFAARLSLGRQDVTVRILDGNASETLQHVRDGHAEIALTEHPGNPPGLRVHPLGEDEMLAIVPRSHPAAKRESISWAELSEFPFIALESGTSLRRLSDQAFAEIGVASTSFVQATTVATAAGMVAAGLGVTAVTRSTLPLIAFASISTLEIHTPTVARRIAVVYRARPSLSPLAEAFLRILKAEGLAPGRRTSLN